MTSGIIAALVATLIVGFVELLGAYYPTRATWMRLRSRHGRRAVRALRERFEAAAERGSARKLVPVLIGLVAVWIGVASLLDKKWHEILIDASPYALIALGLLRTPTALRRVAERMKEYEKSLGEDPEGDLNGDGGPAAIAL